MTAVLQLMQIGDEIGVMLPAEVLARLKLGDGDTLFVVDSANGVTLTPYDPAFESQMNAARSIMEKRSAVDGSVERIRPTPWS